jgi:O-antigen/teichoic acid export membrane protein
MQQKGWTFSTIGLINKILVSLGAILFCLFVKKDFTAIIFAQLLSSVFTVLLVVIFEYKKLFDFLDIDYKQIQHTYEEIFLYAIPFVPSYLFYWILQSGDRVFIKKFSTLNELGVYSLAVKFISILLIFQTSFTTFWVPLSLERFQNDPEDKEFFLKTFNLLSFFMIFILILLILSKDLIVFILPKSYSGISSLIPLLVFMPLMSTLVYITGLGINFYKKTKFYFLIPMISSIMSLILNYFLISRFGAKGAALTNAIVYIFYFYFLTFVSFKYFNFGLNLKKYSMIFGFLFMYAFYSSFYSSMAGNIIVGIIFVVIIIILNWAMIKEYKKLMLN